LNRLDDAYRAANKLDKANKQFQPLKLNFTTNQNFETTIPTPSTFALGSMGGFYNLAELNAQFDDMVASYPGLVTKTSIGNTLQGRPIYVIKISDNAINDENEPEILYTGMHHSREGMSMMNLIFYMRFLLENYATNTDIKNIVDSRELFFIPVVNVDGFNYNTTAANWNATPTPRRMRRKNMAETTTSGINADGSGGDGVDINRNYPTYWGSAYSNGNTASSGTGSADSYRGPSAASEPETVVIQNFVNSRNFKVAINYHCYGNWWIRPQGPDPAVYSGITLPSNEINIYNSIASLFTKYNCYVYGTPEQTVYDVNGYSDDWLFSDPSHAPIYSFSPEIGNSGDGFWCPQSKIESYAKEQIFANLQAAYTAGGYAELQDTSDVAVNITSSSFGYTVTRKGLTDAPINVSINPILNIKTIGPAATISSIAAFGGTSSGNIAFTLPSSIAAGAIIKFEWIVQVDGITTKETITKIYNPTVVFSDDMETAGNFSTNWVSSGTGVAWAYSVASGFGGTNSLTESPAGNYANSANHIIRLTNPLDLTTAAQAYLSFMMKYATENCQDRMQVEISTSGINGTYTPISTNNTIKESRGSLGNVPALTGSTDGWVRETIDLTPYAGNNNIGLRFRFISNAGNAVAYGRDGFQIDNLKVVKSSAIVLPVSFEDITAIRMGEEIQINWKATVDASFKHYKIQHSTNGVHFETIAVLTDPNLYNYIDTNPFIGKNYYRIEVVQTDNIFKYSKTVWVVFAAKASVTVYPNPAINEVTVTITSDKASQCSVEFATIEGKIIHQRKIVLKQGVNLQKIYIGEWANQLYIVKINDDKGNEIKTIKLIKHPN
ncbi:MAG: M14 family zinc carboxypeptidase, partial [Chitinophagaceae bacterium]